MTQAGDNTRVLSVGDPGAAGEAIWSDVLRLMEQVHDNSLLSEEERIARRTRLFDEAVREAERAFSEAQARGDHAQGRRAVEALLRRFPDEPRAKALARRGEQAREAQEADDVATVTRRVNDLISISAWSRAREQVQQLLTRHPDSAPVRQLQLRVEKEYRDFQDEQRRRVYAEVQRFVTRRRWEEACAAARAFLERFPDTSEASALSMQIPTLQANAEIEVRQNLEARIMLFARTGRYIEAAELARTVIRQYPDSPQAEALKGQLPRLEELAHDPNAPPARVRLE